MSRDAGAPPGSPGGRRRPPIRARGPAGRIRAVLRGRLGDPRCWRAACALGAAVAIVLAVVGQREMFRAAHVEVSFLDLLYGSLGLFVFQPPGLPNTSLSVCYQIARFLAPAATFYALADALVLPVAKLQAKLARDHVVICGGGPGALALVAKLRAQGTQVVLIGDSASTTPVVDRVGARPELVDRVGDRGVTVLGGDPTRPAVLRAAGVARADRLYVTGPATGRNAAVLAAAAEIVGPAAAGDARGGGRTRRGPLRCYVEESDPDVLDALWILMLRRRDAGLVDVTFFNTARLGARLLLDEIAESWAPDLGLGLEPAPGPDAPPDPDSDPDADSDADPHPRPYPTAGRPGSIAIAGLGPFGRELLVEIARRRRAAAATAAAAPGAPRGSAAPRLRVVVVDARAEHLVERMRARYQVIDELLEVHANNAPGDEVDLDQLRHPADPRGTFIEQIFVCYDDEELALRKALATARPPTRRSVVVRVNRMNPLGEALRPDRQEGHGPMDALYDDMVIFPHLDRACDPADATDDRLDAWAMAIHADYCRQRLESGEATDDNEALVAWENLPEKYRTNNYDQARDIEAKLREIDCVSARMTPDAEPFAFTEEEVDRLARWEHARWMRNRLAHGWRPGPVRDNEALVHPDLLDYDELPEATREKDVQMVRLIPGLLAGAGYRVVRPTPDQRP